MDLDIIRYLSKFIKVAGPGNMNGRWENVKKELETVTSLAPNEPKNLPRFRQVDSLVEVLTTNFSKQMPPDVVEAVRAWYNFSKGIQLDDPSHVTVGWSVFKDMLDNTYNMDPKNPDHIESIRNVRQEVEKVLRSGNPVPPEVQKSLTRWQDTVGAKAGGGGEIRQNQNEVGMSGPTEDFSLGSLGMSDDDFDFDKQGNKWESITIGRAFMASLRKRRRM